MKQNLVSIIIPTFNRCELLKLALESVSEQIYENLECLIVDDGSTDETESLVHGFAERDNRFNYFKRPTNYPKGANSCRNFGFEKSKGKLINWFDDDDIMLPEFISEKVNWFNNTSKFVIGTGSFLNLDGSLKKIPLFKTDNLFQDYATYKLKVLTPSVMFRRSFLEGMSLFRTDLFRGQEAEFFSRIFYKISAHDYVIEDKNLFLYRLHSDSKSAMNEAYVPKFKESEAFVAAENFKRSIELADLRLVTYFKTVLVNFYCRAAEQSHKKNVIFIRKNLLRNLNEIDNRFAFKFKLFAYLCSFFNRSFFSVEQYFKRYTFE